MREPQSVEGRRAATRAIPRGEARIEHLYEVGVFLFLIVPSMILGLFVVQQNLGFTIVALSTIFRDLALVALIAFFLWRNAEPVASIGWNPRDAAGEIGLGIILFIPTFAAMDLLELGLRSLGLSGTPASAQNLLVPAGPFQVALAVVLVTVVAIAEETIFRGYLILRFENLFRDAAAAVVLSAFVFSLGHGYEGEAGVITVGVMGLIFALVYLWRRSLVAPMTMHFMQDFLAIVLLPLLHILR
jgi:membrane protease YdiL (CAAX protease family)